MISLKSLQVKSQDDLEPILKSRGYCLWISWVGNEVNSVLEHTLEDYGGLKVRYAENQAMWFFFSIDAFLAAAKLEVWAKFNALAVCIQIFEGELEASPDEHYLINLPEALWQQNIEPPSKFDVYVLMDDLPQDNALSGISLAPARVPAGFAPGPWHTPQVDQRLPYKSTLNWYAVLKPVGNVKDNNFQVGWREFYSKVDDILQRNKIRFTIHDSYLMMQIDSLRQFRQWCRDFLALVERSKADEEDGKYWPCVMGVVDRKKLSFNNDLPQQIPLDWDQLMPDYPHMILRDAVLLGPDFQIHEVRFAYGQHDPTSWSNVSLRAKDETSKGMLPNLSPGSMVYGENEYCFYCGHRSHRTQDCPSKLLETPMPKIWNSVAAYDLATMKKGINEIDSMVKSSGHDALYRLFDSNDLPGILTLAIYSINSTVQMRSIPTFWKLRGKQYPKATEDLTPEDDSPIWGVLRTLSGRDLVTVDKEMQNLQIRFPRDYRVFSLHGFVAMERGDYAKADEYWRQAHLLSHPGVMQSWHLFLIARLAEYQGNFYDAIAKYDRVLENTSTWLEAEYRKIVCYVKSGFSGRAVPMIYPLITRDPNFFNWLLLDPELERGYTNILYTLSAYWRETGLQVHEQSAALQNLAKELHNWFTEDNEFLVNTTKQINHLLSLAELQNFVPYQAVIQGRDRLDRDFQIKIVNEVKGYKRTFNSFLERLSKIRDEAAWFPFPKMLADFNRNYNSCAANLNWVAHNNMHVAEVFKKAQELAEREEHRLDKLEKRMRFLRIVRDGTLFALIVFKKFMWMELAGLAMVLLIFPLLVYYGTEAGLTWVYDLFTEQQWAIQKGAIIIISILSLTIASVWTVLRFEPIREKVFTKAQEQADARAAVRAKQIERYQKNLKARRKAVETKKQIANMRQK